MENNTERQVLQVDPVHMCQPLGALYAALGIHGCMPLCHGPSGCCRYHRTEIGQHFDKKVRVMSSLLKEGAAVYGGEDNLMTAVKNLFSVYDPELVAVYTTCLSETIGDDLDMISKNLPIPAGKRLIFANTPGYEGCQLDGYSRMVESAIRQLSKHTGERQNRIFLIPGMISPADVQQIKRLLRAFDGESTVFPDVSGSLDWETQPAPRAYAPGGTPISEIECGGDCGMVVALGPYATAAGAQALTDIGRIPAQVLELPFGVAATDALMQVLGCFYNRQPAEEIKQEREQLIKAIMQIHPYLYGKKVALACDADITLPLAQFLAGVGMELTHIVVGCAPGGFTARVERVLAPYSRKAQVQERGDLFWLEQQLKEQKIDLLLGGTKAKVLARRLEIPMLRVGFPVTDRPLWHAQSFLGYRGAILLLRELTQIFLEEEDRSTSPEELDFRNSL